MSPLHCLCSIGCCFIWRIMAMYLLIIHFVIETLHVISAYFIPPSLDWIQLTSSSSSSSFLSTHRLGGGRGERDKRGGGSYSLRVSSFMFDHYVFVFFNQIYNKSLIVVLRVVGKYVTVVSWGHRLLFGNRLSILPQHIAHSSKSVQCTCEKVVVHKLFRCCWF